MERSQNEDYWFTLLCSREKKCFEAKRKWINLGGKLASKVTNVLDSFDELEKEKCFCPKKLTQFDS